MNGSGSNSIILTKEQKFLDNALFAGIPPEEVEGLNIGIEERRYATDEVIFEEGDEGKNLYLVAEGVVRISKKGRGGKQETLTLKHAGDFFGELALLDDLPRSARATAAEPALLGRIDSAGLNRFISHSPEAALHFTHAITRQLRSTSSLFIQELLNTERLSLVGTMMNSIVHDLRNPIASILMASEYLSTQEQDENLLMVGGIIRDATDEMQTMIRELLDYSRGTTKVDLESTSVKELLETLENQILKRVSTGGVEVRLETDYEGEITVDKQRMMRLLRNIVKNAAESMPRGGTLTLRVRRKDDAVEFEIEDTGSGIPADVLARIFEPFVTHGKPGGTGLGMAIAKAVVEAHQGKIRMESEEGIGTVCRISLPAGC